jgi:hypothetical protein
MYLAKLLSYTFLTSGAVYGQLEAFFPLQNRTDIAADERR